LFLDIFGCGVSGGVTLLCRGKEGRGIWEVGWECIVEGKVSLTIETLEVGSHVLLDMWS